MDHRLAGAGQAGDTGEGYLAVAAPVEAGQALGALGVAGNDGQLPLEVDVRERLLDTLIETDRLLLPPAGEIGKGRVDAVALEQQDRIVGTMRLAERGQHFAHRGQVLLELEVPEGA